MKMIHSRKFRKGSLLGLVLIIGVCLGILGFGMLSLGYGARLNEARSVFRINAREAADAGLRKALYEMNLAFDAGGTWSSTAGPVTLENSNTRYSYTITQLDDATLRGKYYSNYLVESIGTSSNEQVKVCAITGMRNMFDYGLIVTDSLITKNGSKVDGYDSRLGAYGVNGNLNKHVRIGTTSLIPPPQGGITLNQDVVVTGDILVSMGGSVDKLIVDHGATTGPRYNMNEFFEFEPINVPDCGISLGVLNDANSTIGKPGTTTYVKYSSINIPNSGVLKIEGQVFLHVTGDLKLNNGAQIIVSGVPMDFTTWSSAMIFLDGDLDAGNSNGINNMTEKPRNFMIYGTGADQKWTIYNGGDFYGVYYAPYADIEIKAKGDIYGSVSGKSYDMRSAGNLHYDTDLSDIFSSDIGFGIDRWWETAN